MFREWNVGIFLAGSQHDRKYVEINIEFIFLAGFVEAYFIRRSILCGEKPIQCSSILLGGDGLVGMVRIIFIGELVTIGRDESELKWAGTITWWGVETNLEAWVGMK